MANTDNDNRQRKRGASHDLVNCFLHIVDDTIGKNENNLVFLVLLRAFVVLSHIIDCCENLREPSWSVEIYILQRVLVSLKHALKAVTFWVKNIAIERKAMRCFITI